MAVSNRTWWMFCVLTILTAMAVGGSTLQHALGTTPVDLGVYRTGALTAMGNPSDLYRTTGQLPFTYPPFAAILFAPLAALPEPAASVFMMSVSVLALARVIFICNRAIGRQPLGPLAVLTLTLAAGCLEPVWQTISFGQVNLALMWAVLEALLPKEGKPWRGALVGLAAGVKLTPSIFLVIPLIERRWRMLVVSAVFAAATVAAGYVLSPSAFADYWLRALWDPARIGGVAYAGNQSITGAVARFDPSAGHLWWVAAVVVLLPALWVVVTRLLSEARRLHAIVATSLVGLLLSPISWSHHWVWVVPLGAVLYSESTRGSELTRPVRRCGTLLAIGWTAALVLGVIWWAPHGDEQEIGASIPAHVTTSAYVILALLTLVWLLALSFDRQRPSRRVVETAESLSVG